MVIHGVMFGEKLRNILNINLKLHVFWLAIKL